MQKLNWGTGIIVFYVGFVIMIMALVVLSMREKVDLATDSYYAEELVFQQKIDKINNAKTLPQTLKWSVNEEGIVIAFPDDMKTGKITGQVRLYCPSDNTKDKVFDIQNIQNQMLIPSKQIPAGRYSLQIDWGYLDKKYWNEGVIVI